MSLPTHTNSRPVTLCCAFFVSPNNNKTEAQLGHVAMVIFLFTPPPNHLMAVYEYFARSWLLDFSVISPCPPVTRFSLRFLTPSYFLRSIGHLYPPFSLMTMMPVKCYSFQRLYVPLTDLHSLYIVTVSINLVLNCPFLLVLVPINRIPNLIFPLCWWYFFHNCYWPERF